MKAMHKILTYRLTTRDKAGRAAQFISYVAAVGLLVLGFHKLDRLSNGLSEAELFFGVLLVIATGLLMICLGTLTRIAAMWTHAHAIKVQVEEEDEVPAPQQA